MTINPQDNRTCLSIEGNIGAGKSTFLKIIEQIFDIQAVFEPHEKWQRVGQSENLLDKFYKDTARWAYTFQSYAFVTRVVEQEINARKSMHATHILERSVYSDRYCFAKNCFEMGMMNALEWKLYQEWFGWLVDNYAPKVHGFIYLRTDPEVCYKRILKRNRSEEESVSLDYLRMIHAKHEAWLIKQEENMAGLKELPILVLECNEDFEHNKQEQEKHSKEIQRFFGISYKQPHHRSSVRPVSL